MLVVALALDESARREIEEAAKFARTHGRQAQFLPNNLPPQLTSFVDREKVVAEIKDLLQSYCFVTLVGTGGAGKTRCAIKVAAEMLDAYGVERPSRRSLLSEKTQPSRTFDGFSAIANPEL